MTEQAQGQSFAQQLQEAHKELSSLQLQAFKYQRQRDDAQLGYDTVTARIRDLVALLEGAELGQRVAHEATQAKVRALQEEQAKRDSKPGAPVSPVPNAEDAS